MNKPNNLLKSLVGVSGLTLISRVFGFARDMLIAICFGAGAATDAFNVAFRLPNLLRRIFAEGAFSQAFVPILSEYKNKRDLTEIKHFIANISGVLAFCLIIVSCLGIVFASQVIWLTAGGFSDNPAKFELAVKLLQITFPFILFISLASLVSGVLNTWGQFAVSAFMPTVLNLSFIVFIVFFRNYFDQPVFALAWAVFVGGLLQLLLQLPFLKRIGLLVWPKLDFRNYAVWRVLKLMLPAVFALSIAQISLVINTIYASFLPNGSISWMYYADRLMEFPSGVLGVALGTILLPSLSKHAANRNVRQFSLTLDWGVRLCLLLGIPATIGLGLLSEELTMTLFMHGKFTNYDAQMTSYALTAYSFGLIGILLVKIFAPGFFAHQDIKTPVKIAIFVLICTQIMNLAFIGPFKHAGLALSIGLSACINAAALCYFLVKRNLYQPQSGWLKFIIKLIIAVIGMSLAVYFARQWLNLDFTAHIGLRIWSLIQLLIVAIISYFGLLYVLGFRLRNFIHRDS